MSALTDLFTSMANKIRSKTGGSDTYTPTEMVSAVDDVYDAGYENATTPITPSNSSPASMTSGTGYKPTANGYAISVYDTISLRTGDMPKNLYNGSIYKANADQLYAVKSINAIMPDDVDAPALSRNAPYYIYNSSGYAIESQPQSLTPSDSSPAPISSGGMYRAGGAGYAVASQPESKTPSDTSPASVTSGSIVRPSSAGYLYASNTNFKYGTVADKSTASEEIYIQTKMPHLKKFIMWGYQDTKIRVPVLIYDEDMLGSGYFASATIQTGAVAQKPKIEVGTNPTQYNCSILQVVPASGLVIIKQASSVDNIFKTNIQWVASR